MDSATEECIVCENKVIEVQRTKARLEKQVERLKNEGNSKMQVNRNRPASRGGKKVNKTIDEMNEEIDELQTRYDQISVSLYRQHPYVSFFFFVFSCPFVF